jgi:hypothetical protein
MYDIADLVLRILRLDASMPVAMLHSRVHVLIN